MLVLDGKEVPGTDWVRDGRAIKLRLPPPSAYDPPPIPHDRCWWEPNEHGAKPRMELPTVLVGHWTAGEAGTATADDDGPVVVSVMKRRPGIRDLTRRLRVSVHFVIGFDGTVWQTADPVTTSAIHVGDGKMNSRSVGVEVVNKGGPPNLPGRSRPVIKLPLLGRERRMLAFAIEQIRSWVLLAETLADHLPIPRQVPVDAAGLGVRTTRLTLTESRAWKGALEHYHVPLPPPARASKWDAGGQLVRTLVSAGWDLVP